MKTTEFIFTAKESILIYRKQYLYLGEGHVCRSYAVKVTIAVNILMYFVLMIFLL